MHFYSPFVASWIMLVGINGLASKVSASPGTERPTPSPPPTAELVSEKFRKVYSGRLERIASRNSSASWECFRTEIKWLMGKNFSPVSPVPLPSFSPRPFRLSSIIKNNKTPTNLIKTSHKSQKEEQVEEWAERRGTEGQERSRSKTVI